MTDTKKVILICGAREVRDVTMVRQIITNYLGSRDPSKYEVIHGACSGVDEIANEIAIEMKFNVRTFPAEWKKYGKAAGPKRNSAMVDLADELLALPGPNSRGTPDTISKAHKKRLTVIVINVDEPTSDARSE